MLSTGDLQFLRRIDQQIMLHGSRIEPGEIETALRTYPLVKEAVVLLEQETKGHPQLVAFIVESNAEPLSTSALRRHLLHRLPSYMVPSTFVFLDTMPLTSNGKVDRRALRVPEEVEHEESTAQAWSRTPIEELLIGLWKEILGCRQVARHENFFELGGHSLLATRLLAQIRAILNIAVPLRALFEAPTLAGFAQRVEQAWCQHDVSPMPPLHAMERPATIPLSFAQQRLWFVEQLHPGSATYLVPQARRIHGPRNTRALERSLADLIRRHEILRTTFMADAGQPIQVIHPAGQYRLPIIDLRALEDTKKKACVRQITDAEHQCPLDLHKGPLLRTMLLQLADEVHVWLLTLHHILTDGWSNEVLLRELTICYHAFVSGQPSPFAPLPIQYADYALWQRQYLQGEVLSTQLNYWTKRLGGAPVTSLPTDFPRPAVLSARGAVHPFTVSQDLLEALIVLSHQEGVTLFMTLLCAFQILLARYTGQLDIVVGTDSANRTQVQTEEMMGFFVNLLALRTDLSGQPTFREVLRRVREVVLGAYTHQDTPFELLVEKLVPDRRLDCTPLVQVLFVLENGPARSERGRETTTRGQDEVIDPSSLSRGGDEETTVKFDLALFMQERAGMLRGRLHYRLDLFKASTIATLVARLLTLLQSSIKKPDLPIDLLSMTSDVESAQAEQQDMKQAWHIHDDGWFDLAY